MKINYSLIIFVAVSVFFVCPSTGKKKSDLVACSKCCARDDCNIKLCHFPTTKPINTTRCWSCPDGVNDPRNCNHVALCADNEMCHSGMMTFPSGNHSVLHKTGCVRRQFCTTLTMAVMEVKKYQELHNQTHTAKRETGICDICCGTDMCNGTPCTVIRDYLYALYKSGKLNNETLTVQTHHP
ncbi:hypothetical protein ACJMK2_040385 [Sinanodonta woodiana]|uniref:Sodefrin-like factor n=1 Tax=Sinanodonta woodiana TaxID=1069815 RepID=A0ABD3WFV9_SINWO